MSLKTGKKGITGCADTDWPVSPSILRKQPGRASCGFAQQGELIHRVEGFHARNFLGKSAPMLFEIAVGAHPGFNQPDSAI